MAEGGKNLQPSRKAVNFPSRGQVTVPLTIGRAGRGQVNLRQPRCRTGELGEDTLTSDNPDAAKRGMQMHNLREDDSGRQMAPLRLPTA